MKVASESRTSSWSHPRKTFFSSESRVCSPSWKLDINLWEDLLRNTINSSPEWVLIRTKTLSLTRTRCSQNIRWRTTAGYVKGGRSLSLSFAFRSMLELRSTFILTLMGTGLISCSPQALEYINATEWSHLGCISISLAWMAQNITQWARLNQ